MKKIFLILGITTSVMACAQKTTNVITGSEVLRIENFLASDDMRGRKTGSVEIDSAAQFIAREFAIAGLQPFQGSFLQEFAMVRPKFISAKAEMDDVELDPKNVIVVTSVADLKVNEKGGYRVQHFNGSTIKDAVHFNREARAAVGAKENNIIFVDTLFAKTFSRLTGLKRQMFKSPYSTIFILGSYQPKEFTIKVEHAIEESGLKNVVATIPGKSKKDEYVIFSAHYDHIGVGKPDNKGDSIYNGANDDAAGTTAVIMLANHFKKLDNNERTLVFVAFTAEEVGGFGSQYFSQTLPPDSIVAMFNIEMIGTESKWGKNSAFITGFEKTNMGAILQEALKGSSFSFHPDPYPDQQLFYRSDNATLARLGVPAHTISTSKMDSEPNYHKQSDEVGTLDIENMTEIIKAIAESSKTIVSGKQTPTRVPMEN